MKEMVGRWKVRKKKGGMKWVWKKRKVDHHFAAADLTGDDFATSNADVQWSSATTQKFICMTVGDQVFVPPDWDAYDTGYAAALDDAARAIEKLNYGPFDDEWTHVQKNMAALVRSLKKS